MAKNRTLEFPALRYCWYVYGGRGSASLLHWILQCAVLNLLLLDLGIGFALRFLSCRLLRRLLRWMPKDSLRLEKPVQLVRQLVHEGIGYLDVHRG